MDRTELTRIGAALRRQYEVAKQAPLTPSMLALLVQLKESESAKQVPAAPQDGRASGAQNRRKFTRTSD